MSRETVVTAWHLHEFGLADHPLARTLSKETIQTVIALVSTNFRPARPPTTRGTRVASAEPLGYPPEWVTNTATFKAAASRFFKETEEYRQTPAYQSFQPRQETGAPDDSPASSGTPTTPDRRTAVPQVTAPRIESRFRYEDDTPVAGRNQAHVRIPRAPSYSPITDPDHRSTTDSQQASNSLPTGSNPATTRETSAEEAIYDQPIGPNPIAALMDPALQAAITAAVSAAVTQATEGIRAEIRQEMQQANQRGQQGPAGPPGPPGPPGGGNGGNGNSQFQPKHLGFFDPFHDGKSVATGAAMESTSEGTVFRDVHLFMARARDFAVTKGEDIVRRNLFQCLKNDALNWYTSLLTDMEKDSLLLGQGLDQWEKYLVKEFRESPAKAMEGLVKESYSMTDAQHEREPREYAQKIIRLGKSAELPVFNQLLQIWNGLDVDFQLHVNKPTNDTKLSDFLRDLDDRKHSWWRLASKQSSGQTGRREVNARDRDTREQRGGRQPQRGMPGIGYRGRGQPGAGYDGNAAGGYTQNGYFRPGIQPAFIPAQFSNFVPQGNYAPQGYAQAWNQNRAYMQQQQPASQSSNVQQQQPALPALPPRKQLTAGPSNQDQRGQQRGNASDSNRRPFVPFNANARPPQPVYHSVNVDDADANDENAYYDDRAIDDTTPVWHTAAERLAATEGGQNQSGSAFLDGSAFHYGSMTMDASEPSPDVDEPDVNHVASPGYTCRMCKTDFYSNNKLHRHVRICRKERASNLPATEPVDAFHRHSAGGKVLPVVESTATTTSDAGLNFRKWHYARLEVSHSLDGKLAKVCADTGCTMSLIDRKYLLEAKPDATIHKTKQPIRVHGIGDKLHDSSEYTELDFYVAGTLPDQSPAIAHFRREIHLVDDLRAHALLGADILGPEQVILDMGKRTITFPACSNLTASMELTPKGQRIVRAVRSASKITIPPHTCLAVPVKIRGQSLPADRDYSFEPKQDFQQLGPEGGFFNHITDAHLAAVQVRNATNKPVILPKHAKVGMLRDFEEEGCYHASPDDRHLAAVSSRSWTKTLRNVAMMGLAGAFAGFTTSNTPSATTSMQANPSASSVPDVSISEATVSPTPLETVMPNGITVFGDSSAYNRLSTVAEAYPEIWRDTGGTVNVPEEQWMPIPTLPDAKPETNKVYPLSPEDKKVVDKEFDRLHKEGKMAWTSQPTPYGYPVFVVWRTVNGQRKGRVVVDIRGLNKISMFDAYPMPLQSDILSAVIGCPYISVMDCAGFFHQWLVRMMDRHKLTVVSHRGSEQWNVAVMGYRNSPAYVQRQIDSILREYRHFARAYVDDIVVFSNSLEEHLRHLNQIFALFKRMNIALKASKTFLGYPTISLLGQRVDSLGLTTAADKLEAILALAFPQTLKQLETYLGKTGWLRQYVPYYAQKALPLQERKTRLLRQAPNKGRPRQQHSRRTPVDDPSPTEIDAFNQLQGAFSRPTFLVHFDKTRVLYIDVDASKERGFGIMVYHVKPKDGQEVIVTSIPPKRTDVEPIMFLSKVLSPAESRYWPTELEMASLVWSVRKLRLMVMSSQHPVVIYTDHAANSAIVNQTKLTSSSVDKLNLKLIRASTYLSQFRLRVFHKAGKSNIVPDALSRLPTVRHSSSDTKVDSLDLETYHSHIDGPDPNEDSIRATLIEMSPDFRKKLITGYQEDASWKAILDLLKRLASDDAKDRLSNKEPTTTEEVPSAEPSTTISTPASSSENEATEVATPVPSTAPVPPPDKATVPDKKSFPDPAYLASGIDFQLIDDLIYYVKGDQPRLCIPENSIHDVLKLAHDDNFHAGHHRAYDRLKTVYVRRLSRRLTNYIRHCPSCQLNQTKRHKPYGELAPISTPNMPYHTISIDFVLALPKQDHGFDCLMSVTDKFTRKTLLIQGKSTWSAGEWADALIDRLLLADWGIPAGIISDRDRKFCSDLWRAMFKRLGTSLLMSTAYHPQTDGQSERTNQTVEIALRFLITANPNMSWVSALPALQFSLNNSVHAVTGKSPNQVVTGFQPREVMTAIVVPPALRQPPNTATSAAKPEFEKNRFVFQKEAGEATAFAAAKAKILYDKRHQHLKLNPGDKAYLRLHHGYSLPSQTNAKLSNQRTGPFLIKRRIGKLAYELDLPPRWQIHPVISIMQLEPAPKDADPYNRPRPDHPDAVEVEGTPNTSWEKSYEVEKLVKRRDRKYGRTKVVEYLVRWLGYGPEFDEWKSLPALANSMTLVEDYERSNPQSITPAPNTTRATDPIPPAPNNPGRKRGRPSKAIAESQQKRKRGRPRKVSASWVDAYVGFADE